jgi:hypothetical protein
MKNKKNPYEKFLKSRMIYCWGDLKSQNIFAIVKMLGKLIFP